MESLMYRLISWFLLNLAAFYAAVVVVPGLNSRTFGDILLGGVVLALVTGVGGPIARFVTCPLRLVTLGMFTGVVNFGLVLAAFWLSMRMGLAIHAASTVALLQGAAVAVLLVTLGNIIRKGLVA